MLQTKQEIIEKHTRVSSGYAFEYLSKSAAGDAMDEWAKQEGIEYGKWLIDEARKFFSNDYDRSVLDDNPNYKQLWEIFKKQQTSTQTEY